MRRKLPARHRLQPDLLAALRPVREYVLREGFSEEALRGFEAQDGSSRKGVEWVMNHVHLDDIHYGEEATEAQLRYLGRVLKEIHEVKLKADFPDLRFVVEFTDEPDVDYPDFQISFWQAEP
jgi:hypothetical protein